MIIDKHEEIFEIRVRESKELGLAHGEKLRIVGERAAIEGFEEFSFAVDERFFPAEEGGFSDLYEPAWCVTELTTGMLLCNMQDTKEEAIAEAKRILDLKGADVVRKAIRKGLELVGAA